MRYAINQEQVGSRTLDGGTVLIHYDTGYYYTLNGTGTFVWTQLSEREMTFDELAVALADHYGRAPEDVMPDLRQHLEELASEQLLVAS